MVNTSKTTLWLVAGLLALPALAGCVTEGEQNPANAVAGTEDAPERVVKVGVLQLTDALRHTENAFMEEMQAYADKEGVELQFVQRHAQGDIAALDALAAEIAAEDIDVFFALTTPAARSAVDATKDVPVIGGPTLNALAMGLAETVERPGGRFTGVSPLVDAAKQVEVLREAVGPDLTELAIITSGDHSEFLERFKQAAAPAGFNVELLTVAAPDEVQGAFESVAENAQAVYVPPDNIVTARADYLVEESLANGIALMMPTSAMVEKGAFVSYSADYGHLGKQSARLVIAALEGAFPGDMPMEYPQRTMLAVNLKTASEIGITVPDTLLARASLVVQ